MNKSILFILLELFTIRYYREYRLPTILVVRDFVMKRINKCKDFKDFKFYLNVDSLLLSQDEYLCVRSFILYLNIFDKIVKM